MVRFGVSFAPNQFVGGTSAVSKILHGNAFADGPRPFDHSTDVATHGETSAVGRALVGVFVHAHRAVVFEKWRRQWVATVFGMRWVGIFNHCRQ